MTVQQLSDYVKYITPDQLNEILSNTDNFNEMDIERLAFKLGVHYDNLKGSSHKEKGYSLVEWAYSRNELAQLIQLAYQMNPATFPDFERPLIIESNSDIFDVYISHNSTDKPDVRYIVQKLKQRGIKIWYDEEQLLPGDDFSEIIEKGIGSSRTITIFIGPSGIGSWQNLEVKAAISKNVQQNTPIISVLLPGVNEIPSDRFFLKQFMWVQFTSIDDEKALNDLIRGIRRNPFTEPSSVPVNPSGISDGTLNDDSSVEITPEVTNPSGISDGTLNDDDSSDGKTDGTTSSDTTLSNTTPPTTKINYAHHDRPFGEDKLNYKHYAEALAKVVASPNTKMPLTFGIFAAWGMGKSFLLNQIKQELREISTSENNKTLFLIIDFNAWIYSGSENLWAGLVTKLYDEVEEHVGPTNSIIFRLRQLVEKIIQERLSLMGFIILGIILLLNFNEIQSMSNTLLGTLIGGSALVALSLLVKTGTEFTSLFLGYSEQLKSLASKPDFRNKIGFMADIKDGIDTIRSMLKKHKPQTRIVIFIDDLDRCSPNKAIQVLEAIMLLLTDEKDTKDNPFIIFLGLDARILVKAAEEQYGKVLTEAGITGYEYLDKIIQVPFRIPPVKVEIIKNYITSLLDLSDAGEKVEKTKNPNNLPGTSNEPGGGTSPNSDKESGGGTSSNNGKKPDGGKLGDSLKEVSFDAEESGILTRFSSYFNTNPRRIKRVINVYRVVRQLVTTKIEIPKLIKWIILIEQWPFRMALIMEHIKNKEQQGQKFDGVTSIKEVYAHTKIQDALDAAKNLTDLDDDPDTFKKFIDEITPLITVGDIETLRYYIFNLNPAVEEKAIKLLTAHVAANTQSAS